MNILMGVGIFAFGTVVGFLTCALVSSNRRSEDCLNCDVIRDRDADIYSLTKSRDILRDRCDQLEVKYHQLKTKMGLVAKREQQAPFVQLKA